MTETMPTPGNVKAPQPRHWEDLIAGDELHSTGITITDAHLVNWAGLTGDIVQFHINADYAASTPFGERIAHGPLTLSLSLGLVTQLGYFGNVIAWLGLDEVRASKPVLIGDSIYVRATVREARVTSKPENGVWTIDYSTMNQRGEVVMTFTSSFLVRRRDA
ncbi:MULTISPECIES: MaoC/PaaZ C-terminal domain-containing protein [unclassified Microbacterium]|uniref:MaoC/PaaZ C-terminal domain-containing protein n=1 Tax=unclassified Microbacterium TaxID=2609290 RepID=UPI001DB2E8C3|nr:MULTISPECIES: MaoC/PaaZ C-terminal domain-containing protein [unclassified Microbacterium]CAH0156629.1 Bifunctional protein PaaZ [Microbacterium sp. Bi121]HWK78546.1 MaoC/PaaZ C-terminal domain-containing protein [Microbacterium sp.]